MVCVLKSSMARMVTVMGAIAWQKKTVRLHGSNLTISSRMLYPLNHQQSVHLLEVCAVSIHVAI